MIKEKPTDHKETWMEFMYRARTNGLSPRTQEMFDRNTGNAKNT